MVTKYGLSEELGPMTYTDEEDEVFLGRSVTQHKHVSEETARKIDEVVRGVIDRAYERAKTILTTEGAKLEAMAKALLQYETIDKDQIAAIMAGREPGPPKDWRDPKPTSGSPSGGTRGESPIGGPAVQPRVTATKPAD
jgi:cell division protease FtsH